MDPLADQITSWIVLLLDLLDAVSSPSALHAEKA